MDFLSSANPRPASAFQLPEFCHLPRSCQPDFSFEPYFQTDPIGDAVALPVPGATVAGVILARGSGSSELRKEVLNTIAIAIPAAVDAVQKKTLP
jgi:hypothetical protein